LLQKYSFANNRKGKVMLSKLISRDPARALFGCLIVVAGLFLAAPSRRGVSASVGEATVYKWNLGDHAQPLLGLSQDRLPPGFAQSLTYPVQGACTA